MKPGEAKLEWLPMVVLAAAALAFCGSIPWTAAADSVGGGTNGTPSGSRPGSEESCVQASPEEMAKALGITLPHRPWHVANIWWELEQPVAHFTSLEMEVTIDRDVPSTYNLYVSPCGLARINGKDFYPNTKAPALWVFKS